MICNVTLKQLLRSSPVAQMAILDEEMAVQEVGTGTNVFETSWGFSRFIRRRSLRRRGLLAGDCLCLRLTVTVLPSQG